MVRTFGQEVPGIHLGKFTIRLPFIHYKLEKVEFAEALIMCAACMSAIPFLQQILEIPYDLAWSMVIVNGILYTTHVLLGDPVVPGWITPSLPITAAYLLSYTSGPERIKALIALQLMVGLIFLFMGITGLAGKIVKGIPDSLKAGILMGAGFSAVTSEFAEGGRFNKYPITILVASMVMFFMTYSPFFQRLREKNKVVNVIANWGLVPAFLVAVFLGPAVNEILAPSLTIGTVIKLPDIAGILELTLFKVGLPELRFFASGIATAIVIYIIAFGDFVTAGALVDNASKVRPDEKVDLEPNRSNLVCALRNIVEAIFCPYPNMSGPMWSGAYAVVTQRYKEGQDKMDSLISGTGTFRIATLLGVMLIPINGLLQHCLPIALSMMMFLQGYVCVSLATRFAKADTDAGIAGLMGAILAAKGAAWGLLSGIIFYYLFTDIKKKVSKEADADISA